MSFLRQLREYYGVPLRRGARVKYQGRLGVVLSASGCHIRIRFDGQKRRHPAPFHPTFQIEYL